MGSLGENNGGFKLEKKSESVGVGTESFTDSATDSRGSTSSSSRSSSDVSSDEGRKQNNKVSSSSSPIPATLGWPIRKADITKCILSDEKQKARLDDDDDDSKLKKLNSTFSEIDMMKERFAKLLLGEDMSGSGKGVCTSLAISNAITNLCATVFGQLWRLEPLATEKKAMWRREMEWLLCVSDHIIELIPSWQTFPDGSKLEVMTCRPRSDIFMNLPALRKLDNMLLEILDSFVDTEFWYIDQGIVPSNADGSASFRKPIQRQEEKWWLPVPRLPPVGLSESSRKQLDHKRECTNQILKAAMAINSIALTDMEVPDSYLEALPKNGRSCLGDVIYRYITSEQFSPECLLDFLDLSSEHIALEIANRVEAAIYVWRRRNHSKLTINSNRPTTKSSWGMVKDLMVDGGDKRELLAERAESLLLCLKQRFPGLTQTSLDTSKIQFNKDVGKSILESYSRVLESLSFNIVARIDDLIYVDDLTKHADKFSSVTNVSVISHKRVSIPYSVPGSGTPYKTASPSPNFSPAPLVSPARGERTPFIHSMKTHRRGLGVKRVLSNYLGVESKPKNSGNAIEGSNLNPNTNAESTASRKSTEGLERKKESLASQNGSRLRHTQLKLG